MATFASKSSNLSIALITAIGAAAVILTLSSCATTSRHGDVTLTDEKGLPFLAEPLDHLNFPKIPLGTREKFRYRVFALPAVVYPSHFWLEIPDEEHLALPPNRPWSRCIIRASLVEPDGSVFFQRTIDFSKDHRGSGLSKGGRRKVYFPFTDYLPNGTTSLPLQPSYDLEVEIVRASARQSDQLEVRALTLLPKRTSPKPTH